jgi:hypothetical protein
MSIICRVFEGLRGNKRISVVDKFQGLQLVKEKIWHYWSRNFAGWNRHVARLRYDPSHFWHRKFIFRPSCLTVAIFWSACCLLDFAAIFVIISCLEDILLHLIWGRWVIEMMSKAWSYGKCCVSMHVFCFYCIDAGRNLILCVSPSKMVRQSRMCYSLRPSEPVPPKTMTHEMNG